MNPGIREFGNLGIWEFGNVGIWELGIWELCELIGDDMLRCQASCSAITIQVQVQGSNLGVCDKLKFWPHGLAPRLKRS